MSSAHQDYPSLEGGQYSFFGDLGDADDALEAGLEAPPGEELDEGFDDVVGEVSLEESPDYAAGVAQAYPGNALSDTSHAAPPLVAHGDYYAASHQHAYAVPPRSSSTPLSAFPGPTLQDPHAGDASATNPVLQLFGGQGQQHFARQHDQSAFPHTHQQHVSPLHGGPPLPHGGQSGAAQPGLRSSQYDRGSAALQGQLGSGSLGDARLQAPGTGAGLMQPRVHPGPMYPSSPPQRTHHAMSLLPRPPSPGLAPPGMSHPRGPPGPPSHWLHPPQPTSHSQNSASLSDPSNPLAPWGPPSGGPTQAPSGPLQSRSPPLGPGPPPHPHLHPQGPHPRAPFGPPPPRPHEQFPGPGGPGSAAPGLHGGPRPLLAPYAAGRAPPPHAPGRAGRGSRGATSARRPHAGRTTHAVLPHGLSAVPGMSAWVRASVYMQTWEVDEYLTFNMRNTHTSTLYFDDFCYQFWLNKYFGLNVASFKPDRIFAHAPNEKADAGEVAYAKVEGLGRFAYSGIRAPRQLLALDNEAKRGNAGSAKDRANAKRDGKKANSQAAEEEDDEDDVVLQRGESTENVEPANGGASRISQGASMQLDRRVAARKVIEDCNCQVLDVSDIDRIVTGESASGANTFGGDNGTRELNYLTQRRQLLMDNIIDTLCLGREASGSESTTEAGERPVQSDAVFRFLLEQAKGRTLVARMLAHVPFRLPRPPLRLQGVGILHAVLRNLKQLFGENILPQPSISVVLPEAVHVLDASSRVASATSKLLSALYRPVDVLACFQSLQDSDLMTDADAAPATRRLLPLYVLSHDYIALTERPWLGHILEQLVEAAVRVKIPQSEHANVFQQHFDAIFRRLIRHLDALCELLVPARASNVPTVLENLKQLAGADVLSQWHPHCSQELETAFMRSLQEIVHGPDGA